MNDVENELWIASKQYFQGLYNVSKNKRHSSYIRDDQRKLQSCDKYHILDSRWLLRQISAVPSPHMNSIINFNSPNLISYWGRVHSTKIHFLRSHPRPPLRIFTHTVRLEQKGPTQRQHTARELDRPSPPPHRLTSPVRSVCAREYNLLCIRHLVTCAVYLNINLLNVLIYTFAHAPVYVGLAPTTSSSLDGFPLSWTKVHTLRGRRQHPRWPYGVGELLEPLCHLSLHYGDRRPCIGFTRLGIDEVFLTCRPVVDASLVTW